MKICLVLTNCFRFFLAVSLALISFFFSSQLIPGFIALHCYCVGRHTGCEVADDKQRNTYVEPSAHDDA